MMDFAQTSRVWRRVVIAFAIYGAIQFARPALARSIVEWIGESVRLALEIGAY